MNKLKNVTLEMSLKPFKSTDYKYIEEVCRKVFMQWQELIKHADIVSIMLWSSDGSEILDYKGNLDEKLEWAKYVGGANPRGDRDWVNDPEGIGLHTRYYEYMDEPPVFTYKILKEIVAEFKRIGSEITGKPVRVGATFDPGPEFAKSDFKYTRHREICAGEAFGGGTFVFCYSVLNEDHFPYAGFPDGVPQGTPFGTFFGRQSQCFLTDLGFDYLWLSNGFGFGTETWGTTGALFNGSDFDCSRIDEIKKNILSFWDLFRKECPEIRIETRGTNLSTGIDLSTDGVPLKDIYDGNYNLLPPPNSPWAALDGDFGLELVGYMSRIAELPDSDYLYRFYVHDPWWMNSPWFDRYQGYPHDIYLPLAVTRVDENGNVRNPSHINFLTIDNSLGDMPDMYPNEIIPHILSSVEKQPDSISPFVWIYPFREYHEMVSNEVNRVEEVFFGDWFMRGAVNNGLPISTVVSTDNYLKSSSVKADLYKGSVLVTPVPLKDSEFETAIVETVKNGGKVILYGPVDHAGENILEMLNLDNAEPIDGILNLDVKINLDVLGDRPYPDKILHRKSFSAGGISTVLNNKADANTEVLAYVGNAEENRVEAIYRNDPDWKGGSVVWIRGTNSNSHKKDNLLLVPDDPEEFFNLENLLRFTLSRLGYSFGYSKKNPAVRNPVTMIHRFNNAFYFSGYLPDTTVSINMGFPIGAPILMNGETIIKCGCSSYNMPRAWQKECRVFVEQEEEGIISCIEYPPCSYYMRRRIKISGLKNAVLSVFPEKGHEEDTQLLLNSNAPDVVGEPMTLKSVDSSLGRYIEVSGVTGTIIISTPFDKA